VDFSRFFIDRPIFAAVLSIVIFAAGLIAIPLLPNSEYPEVIPPTVLVRTNYPGANPKEIAESVAVPLEEAINGVEGIMYLKSVASSDGTLQIVITFTPGVDPDIAAVRVLNRVSQALPRLPEEVRQYGVTTQKLPSAEFVWRAIVPRCGAVVRPTVPFRPGCDVGLPVIDRPWWLWPVRHPAVGGSARARRQQRRCVRAG
jgi:multidrug efflux pump